MLHGHYPITVGSYAHFIDGETEAQLVRLLSEMYIRSG